MVLLHVKQRRLDAISENLWPYTFVLFSEIRKWAPRSADCRIPYHLFCHTEWEKPSLKHLHTYGCPAFVLDKTLQNVSMPNKLMNRSRMGIYLGPLPNHAHSVHMTLSLQTGRVSPQFHVYFDDMFETIREPMGVPQSYWQNKTRLQGITAQKGGTRANSHLISH